MANPVIGIDVIARLDAFKAEMGKIPGITADDAKLMAAQLNKSIASVAKGAKDAAKSTSDAASSASKALKAFGPLGGVLSKLSPEAGAFSSAIAGLTSATEGFAATDLAGITGALGISMTALAPAVAAVTLAVAAGYAAWDVYSLNERIAKRDADALASTLAAVAPVADRITDATLEADHANGLVTDSEYAYQRAVKAAAAARDEDIRKALEAKKVTEDQVKSVQHLMDGTGQYSQALAQMDPTLVQAAVAVNAINEGYNQQVEQLGRVKSGTDAAKAAEAAKRAADLAAAEAAKRSAEAEKAAADAARARAEIERDLQSSIRDRVKTSESATASLADANRAATEAVMSDRDRILAQLDDEIAKQRAFAQAVEDANVSDKTATTAWATFQDTKVKLTEAADKQIEDLDDKAAESATKSIDAATQAASAAGSAITKVLDGVEQGMTAMYQNAVSNVQTLADYEKAASANLTDSERAELKRREDAQKDSARNAFEANQAAAIASAVVNTALGVTQALASAPPPYSYIEAAATAAAGAVEIASIASEQPAFDTGGMLPPDRRAFVGQPGEGIVSKQGMSTLGGQAGMARVNAGVSGTAQSPMYVVNEYRHGRTVSRYERDRLSRNSPYAQAINAALTPGQRSI